MNKYDRNTGGFTLIELLMAISISMIIMGAIYFGFSSAIDSWQYTKDELALQGVMSSIMDEIIEGTDWNHGLREGLELTEAYSDRLTFVFPWVEEHRMSGGVRTIQLEKNVKPGSGIPSAELRLSEEEDYKPIPVTWEDPDKVMERPRVKLGFEPIPGSTIRLSYFPDPKKTAEALQTFRWDPDDKQIYREVLGEIGILGKNTFGVVISDFHFRFYNRLNDLIADGGDLQNSDLPVATAVEIDMTGKLGAHELTLRGMIMLRNSPTQSGLLILQEGLRVPIPDSKTVQTFVITNLTGIKNNDMIELEIQPRVGKSYNVKVLFEQVGQLKPIVAQISLEYPAGQPLFTLYPRTDAALGIDLLNIGPAGLYDYDDDPGVEDVVMITENPVILTVKRVDVGGAACFIQP